ncbi:hypothetical protein [Pseudarthrobacter sp. Y6]|uniref:hypothetical protein n=1 Tax=Pseudarthrobacter sp. Y6 TaxID=3418422 RepID=UPI003CEF7996
MPTAAVVSTLWVSEWLTENLHHLEPAEIVTLTHQLNAGRDLRDFVIEEAFQALHLQAYGHSEQDAYLFERAVERLQEAGDADLAEACKRYVLALKERAAAHTSTSAGPTALQGTSRGLAGFTELSGTTTANEPSAFAFQADRAITDDEMAQMAAIIGYVYRATICGETMELPERISSSAFKVATDTTKSRRDDLSQAMEQFLNLLPTTLKEGSPIRTTSRQGPGTQGTRLIDGMGELTPALTVFANDII